MKTQQAIATYIVDAFTDQPFKGNPAGVCLLEAPLAVKDMQAIAKELGLSETAFVHYNANVSKYAIRYFSPKMEIPLCGHATLAASKVIFESHLEWHTIRFETIGHIILDISRKGQYIEMEFPIYETLPQPAPKAVLEALGLEAIANSAYNIETRILLLELDDSAVLRELTPDFERLVRAHDSINGVLVTALSKTETYDFESRYFWPWSGTNEDPVTGGTHTFLAKYWGTRLGKTKMKAYQCSERSGFMDVELLNASKMLLRSEAQIVFKGELFL